MTDREQQDMGRMGTLTESKREEDDIRDDRAAGGTSGPSTSSERFDREHRNQYGGHTGDEAGMTDSAHHSGDVKTRGAEDMGNRPGYSASMGDGGRQGSSDMGDDDMETGGGGSGRRREYGYTGGAGTSGGSVSSNDMGDGDMQTGGGGSGKRREYGSTGGSGSGSSGGMGSSGSGSSGGMGGSSEGNEG